VVTAALPSQKERREFNQAAKSTAETEYGCREFSSNEQTCCSEARSQDQYTDREIQPQNLDGCETDAHNGGEEQDQHPSGPESPQENSGQ